MLSKNKEYIVDIVDIGQGGVGNWKIRRFYCICRWWTCTG